MASPLKHLYSPGGLLAAALVAVWCVGMFGRGYWTPDEPREADIAWRMSWQADRAVPLLAGDAFCEKPPLTYWIAAIPIRLFGPMAWSARLPNLLYAVLTALSVGLLARSSAGRLAGIVAAAAVSTFLLSYQVAIWLATDAPLLAAESIALLGAYQGFYALSSRARLRGYLLMHAALGAGFLCKSAAAWMVPALTILALVAWEKRWRELLRWELYAGLLLQAAMILSWIYFVYTGADGVAHLKVFFWNNLVGRFTHIDAPNELQYAAAHRNSPGKYLIEMPLYLAPWTLLVLAALRQAWRRRHSASDDYRAVRFALAASLPALLLLSVAATARNIYFAPALPGVALLLAWWARDVSRQGAERFDAIALRATSVLLLMAVILCAGALGLIADDAWARMDSHALAITICGAGLALASWFAVRAWIAVNHEFKRALWSLLLAYCALLVGPASQAYLQVNTWQNLASVAHAIERDADGKPLILFAPDETTRAMIDMYARTRVDWIAGPIDTNSVDRLRSAVAAAPQSLVVIQLPGLPGELAQRLTPTATARQALPDWLGAARLRSAATYSLPNGRRYALLASQPPSAARSGNPPASKQFMVERVVFDDLARP